VLKASVDVHISTLFRTNDSTVSLESLLGQAQVIVELEDVFVKLDTGTGKIELTHAQTESGQLAGGAVGELKQLQGLNVAGEYSRIEIALRDPGRLLWVGGSFDRLNAEREFDLRLLKTLERLLKEDTGASERFSATFDDDTTIRQPPSVIGNAAVDLSGLAAAALAGATLPNLLPNQPTSSLICKSHKIVQALIAGVDINLLEE
jgi:hypothetical protein